jgi:hypothetical protein
MADQQSTKAPIPYGFCQCGCGRSVRIAQKTIRRRGWVKGEPIRFMRGHHTLGVTYPRTKHHGRYAAIHVLIAEAALGRPLPASAEVHHADTNVRNNARTNLVICENHAYHCLLHVRTRVVRAGGDPNTQLVCAFCKQLKPFAEFPRIPTTAATGRHSRCRACVCQRQIRMRQLKRDQAKERA